MLNGLAAWHYPHRSIVENIYYFAEMGFQSISLGGYQFRNAIKDECTAEMIAEAVSTSKVVLTVHDSFPPTHGKEDVLLFRQGIEDIACWQSKHPLISVLSFDVPTAIRGDIHPYLRLVLERVADCRVAVEDFGLDKNELQQLDFLKTEKRFGFLIDIGHMYIRLCGKNESKEALFQNYPDTECEACEHPGYKEFLKAFGTKRFPIYEIHLHNNNGKDDVHWFLENGTLDIRMIAQVIKQTGYDGIMTLESAPGYRFSCSGSDADDGIRKTYDFWKKIYLENLDIDKCR